MDLTPPPIPERAILCQTKFVPGTGKIQTSTNPRPRFAHLRNSSQQIEHKKSSSAMPSQNLVEPELHYADLVFSPEDDYVKPSRPPKSSSVKSQISAIANEKSLSGQPKKPLPPIPPRNNSNQKSEALNKKLGDKKKGPPKKK